MRTKIVLLIAALSSAAPVLAHHSFSAVFDGTKKVSLTGTVTKLEWANPHIWVYFDVKETNGAVTPWQCEGGAPNSLVRQGWNKNSLKTGEVISVEGSRAKDGSNTCSVSSVKTPDGKRLFAGQAQQP
ncbi:MAG TPA: DUF6152 family protein [Vicinamibacterales bacterium]|jgi:hypothetical protein